MAALAYRVDAELGEAARSDEPRRRTGFRVLGLGLAFGTGANLVAFRFVPAVVTRFTGLGWGTASVLLVLLSVEQSLRWGVATWLHAALRRRRVPSALAFAAGVFAGTFVPAVFPWSAAGGVTPVPAMVQLAEVVGERGVTFVMALAAGLLGGAVVAWRQGLWRPAWVSAAAAVLLPVVTYGYGHARLASVEAQRALAPTTRIALVQPSIEATARWDPDQATAILKNLTDATRRAEQAGAALTVWPEAAYPFLVSHRSRRCPVGGLAMLPFGVRGPVLTGVVMTGANGDLWNSAAICTADGALSPPQDKIHLLWFGETIPLLDRIPWVRTTFSRGEGLVAGETTVLETAGAIHAAVLNCFEDTLPDAGREAMRLRPNLLVNVTNDSWFAGSAESELHLRLAALRAVESRRDLVRAVNFGATSWVDAGGIVRARSDDGRPDVLYADAALLATGPTPFDRFGDVPLAIAILLGIFVTRRRG